MCTDIRARALCLVCIILLTTAATAGCAPAEPVIEVMDVDSATDSGSVLNNAGIALWSDFADGPDCRGILTGAGSNTSVRLDPDDWEDLAALACGTEFTVAVETGVVAKAACTAHGIGPEGNNGA